MGAAVSPNRLTDPQGDVVHGTNLGAPAAPGAAVPDAEGLRLDKERVERRIHRAAHEAVIEIIPGGGKGPLRPDGGDSRIDGRFGPGHNLPSFLHLGCVKHGDIILRHNDLHRSHAGQALSLAKGPVIPGGAANLAAAGHDKPHPLCSGHPGFQQPVPHQAGNPPCVGGCDYHQILPGLHRRGVLSLDALIQIQQLVVQLRRHTLCHMPTIACAGKIQDHMVSSSYPLFVTHTWPALPPHGPALPGPHGPGPRSVPDCRSR